MNPTWVIAKRELGSFFDSLIAYILLIAFLGFTGFFTWLYAGDVFYTRQASLYVFFQMAQWTLFFFIPAITMRQLAEEKHSGTLELLLTKAVTDMQLVMGKFLSCLLMVCIALAFTIPYYISISYLGDVDHGAIISGYLGLLLMSAAYIAIGLFASSTTDNQIVAFLLALIIGVFFHFITNFLAVSTTGWVSELFSTISMTKHYDSISRGVIDTKDLVYFGSIIFMGLFFTKTVVSDRDSKSNDLANKIVSVIKGLV